MCRANCHKIIKLSGALQEFAAEKEEISNVRPPSFPPFGTSLLMVEMYFLTHPWDLTPPLKGSFHNTPLYSITLTLTIYAMCMLGTNTTRCMVFATNTWLSAILLLLMDSRKGHILWVNWHGPKD